MRWFTKHLRNIGMASVSMLFLLTCLALFPLSAVSAHEGTSAAATPTVDATVTALNKEQLVHENDWWWNYGATILTSVISTFTLAAAGIFTVVRYFNDRRDARKKEETEANRLADDSKAELEKRAEERFQAAVAGLGDEKEGAKIGAAILLRTFLRPGYKRFYAQTFDLAVAHLRLSRTSHLPENPMATLPPTTLSQALIVIFKEAFPLARSLEKRDPEVVHFRSLDATGIQLDHAYLWRADLKQAFIRRASLRAANLFGADLSETNFSGSNFNGANLNRANFSEAYLRDVNFSRAYLRDANFSRANLGGVSVTNFSGGNFSEANLNRTNFSGAYLRGANFSRAYLRGADFSKANLSGANLSEANLEDALSLEGTNLRGVNGLTKEQLAACKAKGAIVDEDLATSACQPTVAPSSLPQSNDTQASSAPPAQESPLLPDPDGNKVASFQPDPES